MSAVKSFPAHHSAEARLVSWVYAALISLVFTALTLLLLPTLHLTFVIALALCLLLIGVDGIHWLRGEFDTFDPQGIVGVFGLHFYVAAPVLHVLWDYWAQFATPAQGWLPALERSVFFNLVGLIIYRVVLGFGRLKSSPRTQSKPLDPRTFKTLAWFGALFSFTMFAVFLASRGGPVAYFMLVSEDRNSLEGSGWLLLLGEAFPLLALAATVIGGRERLRRSAALLVAVILLFIAAQFFVGGLRGSRSNTIWPVLIGLGMIHLLIRPISARKFVAVGLIGAVFMYGYSFYKGAGTDALGLLTGETTTAELTEQTGRSFEGLLLGDFGRADVQALILSRSESSALDHALGQTYIGDLALLTPPTIRESLPPSKTHWGTEAWFGPGANDAGLRTTRIFGAAGEATLNFGAAGFILSFPVIGYLVRRTSAWYRDTAAGEDIGRKIVAGSACIVCVLALGSDLDNVVWFAIKQLVPLFFVVTLARTLSRQQSRRPRHHHAGH